MFLHQTFVLLVKTGEVNVSQYKNHLKFIVKQFEVKGLFLRKMINGDLHWHFHIKLLLFIRLHIILYFVSSQGLDAI